MTQESTQRRALPRTARTEAETRARLAEFTADVGRILTESDDLDDMLRRCAEALVVHLDAAFGRIWTLDETGTMLELRASAGAYTHLDGPHGRVAVGNLKIGRIAEQRTPFFTNDVLTDAAISDPAWAAREGMIAFAGHPLLVGDRLLGVMAMFSRTPIEAPTAFALAFAANLVALGIDRLRTEEALRRQAGLLDQTHDAVLVWDRVAGIQYWNRAAEELYGYSRAEALGRVSHELLRTTHPGGFAAVAAALERDREWIGELTHTRRDGSVVTVESRHRLIREKNGRDIVLETTRDITERKRIECEQQILLDVGDALNGALDVHSTSEALTRALVPSFADAAGVHMLQPDGSVRRIFGVRDGRQPAPTGSELNGRAKHGPTAILNGGPAEFYPDVPDELLAAVAVSSEHLAALHAIGIVSLMTLPIVGRDSVIASLTLQTDTSGRRYDARDFAFGRELARRAALAMENARLYDELKATAESLALANVAKDEFVGLVSHELRTPITTIYGNARVLKQYRESIDPEDRDDAIADIESEADRLQRIVENMLILARFDRTAAIDTEPVDIARAVEAAVIGFRRRHLERMIETEIEPELPFADVQPTYLDLVLTNLLSNADKYSPPDVPVEVRVMREGAEIKVRVLDRGSGVLPEEVEEIFSPFYRSTRTKSLAGGMGIGLAVCRRIMEAQGCRIWAALREGGGTEFGFSLPIEVPDA